MIAKCLQRAIYKTELKMQSLTQLWCTELTLICSLLQFKQIQVANNKNTVRSLPPPYMSLTEVN